MNLNHTNVSKQPKFKFEIDQNSNFINHIIHTGFKITGVMTVIHQVIIYLQH